MWAKDETATISHPGCGGTYEYSSPVSKLSESKPVKSKPSKSMPIDSESVEPKMEIGQKYFHPKINLIEKYRCNTCFEVKKCPQTFMEKILCLIDFKFKTLGSLNPNVEGVLIRDPSEFEIIELDDIKQKINVHDIVRLFINRDDRYSLQDINNPDKFPDKNGILTYDIILKSLKGEITIGTRPVNPKTNTIKWIAWDIDKDHNENPKAVAYALVKYLKEWYRLTGYIELSGSIDSYHVWVFLMDTNNDNAYNFDQDFRKRLKSIGIGVDPNSIERGVQKGDGGMIKLPYNIQRKEKYGHKGGRSRFIEGVDLSKIVPEKLPAPWGNSQNPEINTLVPVTEEKTDEQKVNSIVQSPEINTSQPMAEEKIDQQDTNNILNEVIRNNEKVDGMLKCDKCLNESLIYQMNINEIINKIKNNKHTGCGGNVSFGIAIYETSIQILKSHTESVRDFCMRLIDSQNKKTAFDYEIRQTFDDNFENTLILKTKTEKDGKELAGWLVNSNVLKGKLYQPAPKPFQVKKYTTLQLILLDCLIFGARVG